MPRRPGASRPAGYGHVDDAPAAHRLRPWTTRRCAAALPTAATFDHMPTAFHHGSVICLKLEYKRRATGRWLRAVGRHKELYCLVARQICSKVEQHRQNLSASKPRSDDKHSRVTFLREATQRTR